MDIFWWLIQNGLSVVALLPLVWILCLTCRWRPACQHFLWILLLVKFIFPPVILWPVSNTRFATDFLTAPFSGSRAGGTTVTALQTVDNESSMPHSPTSVEAAAQISDLPVEYGHVLDPRVGIDSRSFILILTILWGAGSLAAVCMTCRRIVATVHLLRESHLANPSLQAIADRMSLQFGLGPIAVRLSQHVTSPSVSAFPCPVILWPTSLVDFKCEQDAESLLAHEFAHIKRRDHWFLWLELFVATVWWWNPVYRYISRRLHETRELACDALALKASGTTPEAYAVQLVNLTAGRSRGDRLNSITGLGISTQFSLQRRIRMLFESRLSSRISIVDRLTIAVLALALVPVFSWGQTEILPVVDGVKQPNPTKNVADDSSKLPISEQTKADQPANAGPPTPNANSIPRPIPLSLFLNEPFLTELGLKKDSSTVAELRKLSQTMTNDIQNGLREAFQKGDKSAETVTAVYVTAGEKFHSALKSQLSPRQFERLQQLHWQKLGVDALRDSELASALRLTKEQRERLLTTEGEIESRRKDLSSQKRALESEHRSLLLKDQPVDETKGKIQEIQLLGETLEVDRSKKYLSELTDEQRKKLDELLGKRMEFPNQPKSIAGRAATRTTARPGGLMTLALKEAIMKELGLSPDSPVVAQLRKLADDHSQELHAQLRTINSGDQESIQVIEGKLQEKFNPQLKLVLSSDQFDRLRQIGWQDMGTRVFFDPEIVSRLEITQAQREKLHVVLFNHSQLRTKLRQEGKSPDDEPGGEMRKKIEEATSERNEMINQLFSKEQLSKLTELKGKPFDLKLLRTSPNRQPD